MTTGALKSGWKMVKFGDVVRNANLVERDPVGAGIEKVVGLEHLDSGNLHVRRWNNSDDGTSFSRKFVPGQTLFGKRRAYQRKVAFAEFEGICSGDILTFEPIDQDVLLPELLPFICQTDAFFDYALGTSAGSLSPRTSWKMLKNYKLPLPPLKEQKRIAEILWAADEAVEKYRLVQEWNRSLYQAQIEILLFNKKFVATKVESAAKVNSEVLSESRTAKDFKFKYIDIGSIIAPKIMGKLDTYIFANAPSRARRCVKDHDILISTVRPNLQSFIRLPQMNEPHIASTGFAVISPINEIIGSLLFHSFFSKKFMRYCEARVTGTSYPAISVKDIAEFKVYIPNRLNEQVAIQESLDNLDAINQSLDKNILDLSQMLQLMVSKAITTGDLHV